VAAPQRRARGRELHCTRDVHSEESVCGNVTSVLKLDGLSVAESVRASMLQHHPSPHM
jgi:hypothetical protein